MSKFVTSIKSQDLTLVSLMNMWNLTIVYVDPLFEAIHHGTAGTVIAAVLAESQNLQWLDPRGRIIRLAIQ